MTGFCKYDVVVVKFPFASSLRYKARPAVIVSSNQYNENDRNTLSILAISSQIDSKLNFEKTIKNWEQTNLLKPSIFKSSIATIEKEFIITKLGSLSNSDKKSLDRLLEDIC
jgi:mRNA interferase MazF